MLFKSLHSNSISATMLTPLAVILLWLRYFVVDIAHFTVLDNPSMPLWDVLILPYFGYSSFTAALASLILVILTGVLINTMAVRYGLIRRQSLIVLLVYALLTSAFLSVQKLSPVWFFVFFFVAGLNRVFGAVGKRKPAVSCFDGSFLLGLGTLFYAKGLFFFPLLIIAMGVLRLLSFKALAASILGFLFPSVISYAWYFLNDQGWWFYEVISENLIANPGQYNHTIYSKGFMALLILPTTVSLLVTVRQMGAQKIIVRRYYRIFIWIVLITAALVLSPFFSMEIMPLSAVGVSMIMVNWLELLPRKALREAVFIVLIAAIIAGQFLLF